MNIIDINQNTLQKEIPEDIIISAIELIDEEYRDTDNTWIECYGSCLIGLKLYIFNPESIKSLSAEQIYERESKFIDLVSEQRKLMSQYPDKNSEIPDDIKSYLIGRVKDLKTLL